MVNRYFRFNTSTDSGPVHKGKPVAESFMGRVEKVYTVENRTFADVVEFTNGTYTGIFRTVLLSGPPIHLDFLDDYVVYPYQYTEVQ